MLKRPSWNLRIKRFWLNIGWYGGETFKVLALELVTVDFAVDLVQLFCLQVAHFQFAFGFDL